MKHQIEKYEARLDFYAVFVLPERGALKDYALLFISVRLKTYV